MPASFDTIIVGAGVAGLSTAYHLAAHRPGTVLVIEKEKELGGHSSGRNAGMIRQAVADPVLARLACEGRKRLGKLKKNEWPALDLKRNGSLLLASGRETKELLKTQKSLKRFGVRSFFLSKKEAAGRVPVLKHGDFDRALFCPSDAFLRTQALLKGFEKNLKKRSVSLRMGLPLASIKKENGGFRLTAGKKVFFCKKLVNASGAWAARLAREAGASKIPLIAYRRHLFWSRSFGSVSKKWPFVWDLSHEVYFRPDKNGVMLSPCDKKAYRKQMTEDGRQKIEGEDIDPKMAKILKNKLYRFSNDFEKIQFYAAKAGLRTMTPDGRFVIGEDPKLKGFYWVAGLGGHGVTTCFSVGKLASDIIIGNAMDHELENALSPKRFLSSVF